MGFRRVTSARRPISAAATALAGAALVLASLAGCSRAAPPRPAPSGTGTSASVPPAASLTWVVERQAVNALRGAGMSEAELSALFGTGNTYAVGGFAGAHRTATVTNLSPENANIPAGTTALLYDDEHWPLTPAAQQLDPAKYEAQALQWAHGQGMVLIATPAPDLADVLDPGGSGTADERFLALDVIAAVARNADVVDIQAQGLEGSTLFAQFVTTAARQARAANPHVKVLAGISTNPSGRTISARTFAADADAVRGVVDGYWLNIPSASRACPRCGTARPAVAVPWLESLLGRSAATASQFS